LSKTKSVYYVLLKHLYISHKRHLQYACSNRILYVFVNNIYRNVLDLLYQPDFTIMEEKVV